MALNPAIALQIQPPQFRLAELPSPLDQYGRVLSLRNMMAAGARAAEAHTQESQLRALRLQAAQQEAKQARQEAADEASFRALYRGGQTPTAEQVVGTLGSKRGLTALKTQTDIASEKAQQDIRLFDLNEKKANALGNLAQGILDADTPEAYDFGIATAEKSGLITPEQATQFRAYEWGPQTRAQLDVFAKRSVDAADQWRARREQREAEIKEPGLRAEALQKAAQQDAMILATAAAKGPEALNAALAKLPAERQQTFVGATTPKDILMRVIKPEVGTSLPYPSPVFEQKVAIQKAGVPAPETDRPLVETIKKHPEMWPDLSQKTQERLAPVLAQEGFTQFGKPPGEAALAKQSDLNTAIAGLEDLETTMRGPGKNFIGPVAGLLAADPTGRLPGSKDAKAVQAQVDLIRQRIGKALEGGVLRKEDEAKYKRILPTMTDPFDTAMKKIEQLRTELNRDLQTFEAQQRRGGRALPKESAPSPRIKVISPGGKPGTIPADQWEEAQKQGYRRQ